MVLPSTSSARRTPVFPPCRVGALRRLRRVDAQRLRGLGFLPVAVGARIGFGKQHRGRRGSYRHRPRAAGRIPHGPGLLKRDQHDQAPRPYALPDQQALRPLRRSPRRCHSRRRSHLHEPPSHVGIVDARRHHRQPSLHDPPHLRRRRNGRRRTATKLSLTVNTLDLSTVW